MTCPFCRVAREGDPRLVTETDASLVLLDRRPIFPGHSLVVPKVHHERVVDLPDDEMLDLMRTVGRVAEGLKEATDAEGVDLRQHDRPFLPESELVVRHLHVHVLPRWKDDALKPMAMMETITRYPASSDVQDRVLPDLREALDDPG